VVANHFMSKMSQYCSLNIINSHLIIFS